MNEPAAGRIHVLHGDITECEVDAIVTAANEALCGGHGVDGAVHREAGRNASVRLEGAVVG